jgi:hypothetical protein
VNPENRLDAEQATRVIEARCHARFKLSIDVKIRSHSSGLLMGRMVDISESGTAVMLTVEVPLDDVVQLEFALSLGRVENCGFGAAAECVSLWLPVRGARGEPGTDRAHLPSALYRSVPRQCALKRSRLLATSASS